MEELIPVKNFYMIRLGITTENTAGDFLDCQSEGLSFAVSDCGDDNDYIAVFNSQFGTLIYKDKTFSEVVNVFAENFNHSNLDKRIFSGLLKSTYDNDADGLIDVDGEFEEMYFEASESDDVSDYSPCVFGIGSVSSDLNEIFINTSSFKVVEEGEELDNLSELYGRFDEDSTWVVGLRME